MRPVWCEVSLAFLAASNTLTMVYVFSEIKGLQSLGGLQTLSG